MYIYMPQKQHNWPLWDKSINVIYKKEISVHFQFQGCQYRYRAQSASQLLESDTFVLWFWELWPKHKCFDFIDQIVWSSSSIVWCPKPLSWAEISTRSTSQTFIIKLFSKYVGCPPKTDEYSCSRDHNKTNQRKRSVEIFWLILF